MVKTLERDRYALCEKLFLFPFCCSYQVYRYLAGCFDLISCRHYLKSLFRGAWSYFNFVQNFVYVYEFQMCVGIGRRFISCVAHGALYIHWTYVIARKHGRERMEGIW